MKRFHVIKASRNYEGSGYCGDSSKGKIQEFSSIAKAKDAIYVLQLRNNCGWIIIDSKTGLQVE